MSGRPCNVSEVLVDMVDTIRPLALNQKRVIELSQLSSPLLAAVAEPELRQAFSNLIEGALLRTHVGGKVAIVSNATPAGDTLVCIDDDGPDMHYMVTSVHSPYFLSICTVLFNKLCMQIVKQIKNILSTRGEIRNILGCINVKKLAALGKPFT